MTDLSTLRARHKKDPRKTRQGETWCDWCKTEWPCEARQGFDALDAEQAAIAHHNETVAWRELA